MEPNPHTRIKQRQNAESRKPEIVKSFYHTIVEEGFEGASIAKVAKRINIHPSLVLHYFETKENLTLALVDNVIEEYAILLDHTVLKDLPPQQRFNRLLETLWSRDYYEKIQIAASFAIIAVSFRNPRIQHKVKGLYRRYKGFLAHEFRELAEAGVIGITDAEKAAEIIMTLIEGSRHFGHFAFDSDWDSYNRRMIETARQLLTHPPETF